MPDPRQKRRHFGTVIADALGEKIDAVGRSKAVEKKLLEGETL